MFLVRSLFVLTGLLVCTLMASDVSPVAFLLAFVGWALMEWAGVFRRNRDSHQGPKD
jgi:hypothetical protein